jgi:hypothetical protein
VSALNGLQLLDRLKETENKMLHLHKAIDKVSTEPDFKESVSVLTVVVRDYQQQLDKLKEALGGMEISLNHPQGQSGQSQSQSQSQPNQ